MKWLLSLLLGFLLVAYLALVFYANRAVYGSRFDAEYWRDKYENSQWLLPQSKRGIGDDGVYLYQGHLLIRGGDPTLLNAEVPPLGKYAIGASLALFGNGQLYGFITTTAALIVFFFLTRTVLVNTTLAIATTLLVALDPLVTSQFALPMLESLQLLTLLLTIVLAILTLRLSSSKKQIIYILLTGLSLGLFSVSKFPLFTPIVGAPIVWFLWKKTRSSKFQFAPLFAIFSTAFLIGFLLPYLQYFRLGHTLFDWIGVQKWIVNFYRSANLKPSFGSMATTMLVGKLQNLFTHAWEPVPQWTPTWTVLLLVFPIVCARMWKRYTAMVAALVATVVLFNIIPFWTRYLVPLLPLLYLATIFFFAKTIKRLAPIAIAIILIFNAWTSYRVLFPTPETTVTQFLYNWQYGLFQDMYELTTDEVKTRMARDTFHRIGQTLYHDGQIEAVMIKPKPVAWNQWQSPQIVPLEITYITRNLGAFAQTTELPVVNVNGTWRIPWQWEFLVDGTDETKGLHSTVNLAKRGTITDKKKAAPVARDLDSWLVWVTPKDIDTSREDAMLQFLQGLFDKRVAAALFHLRYSQQPRDLPVALGVARVPLEDGAQKELLSYPGLTLTPAFYRWTEGEEAETAGYVGNTRFIECCSYLYNTTLYDGLSGWEKEYNEMLKGRNGGSLVIKDANGNIVRTILSVEKQDGQNVEL